MLLTNYRKFIVERYLELNEKITIEEYCQNVCRTHVKVKDFKVWLRLYDFQPLKIQLEKELEYSKNETKIVKIKLREIKRELEITKFVAADKKNNLAKYTIELTEAKVLHKKMKAELKKENLRLETELKKENSRLETELKKENSRLETELKKENSRLEAELKKENSRLEAELKKENLKLKIELSQANFEISQIKSELTEALEDVNSSQRIFQNPKICAKSFVDTKKEGLLIENTIEEFKHYFNLTSYKSAFLELGIQINISDEGSVRLNRLMKKFCYKTAYEAIRYFKQNKVNSIAIEQKPTVEEKVSFMAFSIDPSQNNIGFINPIEIE